MYEFFMSDYIEEAQTEMNRYLGITERAKEGVYKENFYLRDHLQTPKITKQLAKKQIREAIFEFVGSFMDEHEKELSTSGPVYTFTFGETQLQPIYNIFGLTPDELIKMYDEMIQATYFGRISVFFNSEIYNAPHKLMITAILIDAVQNNYEDIIECCEFMWAFCEYPILYRKFWKSGVKEELMNYTIEHLGAKFQIKKVSNLKGLLQYDAHTSVTFMMSRLQEGDDSIYMDLMYRIRNQIRNKLRNISNAYYENYKLGASQHINVTTFDDGSLADQEGHTTNTAQVVTNTISKFTTGGINNAMAKVSADHSKVDKDNLIGYINQINATKNNRMGKLIEDIITAFFVKYPTSTSVGGIEFINFGLSLYRSIGTSHDPLYQEIRSILNYWMDDIIQIKNFYQRPGTIINYTRAIFDYVVLMIQYYN